MKENVKINEEFLVKGLVSEIDIVTNKIIKKAKESSLEEQINAIIKAAQFESDIRSVQNFFLSKFSVFTKYDKNWQDFLALKNIEIDDIYHNETFREFHRQLVNLNLNQLLIESIETNLLISVKAFHDQNSKKGGEH